MRTPTVGAPPKPNPHFRRRVKKKNKVHDAYVLEDRTAASAWPSFFFFGRHSKIRVKASLVSVSILAGGSWLGEFELLVRRGGGPASGGAARAAAGPKQIEKKFSKLDFN